MTESLTQITLFFSGITMAMFLVAGMFFIRFWKTSRDRFFLLFAVACWLLAIERVVALFIPSTIDPLWSCASESMAWVYLVRLFAFVAIAIAIWEKNRLSK